MRLDREKLVLVIFLAALTTALITYLVFYIPLIRELRIWHAECKKCEDRVGGSRAIIEGVKLRGSKGAVLTKEDVSFAIDELTKEGKLKGINFISISPNETAKKSQAHYEILPIEMEIESGYEALGTFLGSLDEYENSLITVKSFKTTPYEGKDPAVLNTRLIIEMYLLGEEYAR